MTTVSDGRVLASRILIWIARILGTLLAAIVLLILAAHIINPRGPEGEGPSLGTLASLAIFPFGAAVGLLLGWRWPVWGGIVTIACMAYFFAVIEGWVVGGGSVHSPSLFPMMFVVLAVLYVAGGLMRRGRKMRPRLLEA